MTYILRKDQVEFLRSRKRFMPITEQLKEAATLFQNGKIKVVSLSDSEKKSNKIPLLRFPIECRIDGIGSKEMRGILDAYSEYCNHLPKVDHREEIAALDREIAALMSMTIKQRNKDLLNAVSRRVE